jgi:hypothetical protein
LTSIDPAWARVAESPRTLVPLVHELVRYAGTPPEPPRNLRVGETYVAETEGYPRLPVVVRPDGSRRALAGEPTPVVPGVWRLPPVEVTDRAGLYALELESGPALPFAIALDPSESDLERLDPLALSGLHPALVLVASGASPGGAAPDQAPAQGELWRSIALLCVLALVGESLWAAWIGRRRSAA